MSAVTIFVLFWCTAALAYANGSNDVSKGIATLVGSGVTNYRRAILWGTAWTVAGSLVAAIFSQRMVVTFNESVISPQARSDTLPIAVLIGATGWVLFATRTGLPVSTTHAITGALCGAAIMAYGWRGVLWGSLVHQIVIPLLFSPLISCLALWGLFPALRYIFTPLNRRCACVEASSAPVAMAASPAGNIASQGSALDPILVVDHLENCSARSPALGGIALGDGLHWLSSGLTSFARGLNDAPKIVAVGLGLALALHQDSTFLFVVVALAMGLGSALAGQRVTKTLAEKITAMSAVEGLSANLITSILVTFASRWGMPVSTTHVSTGAITGIGLRRGRCSLQWNTVWVMLQAWVITLPVSAGIAGVTWWVVSGGGRG